MQIVRGLGLGFVAFAAFFALHIVGGATDQGWLFAIAVGLIYASAMAFAPLAATLSGAAPGTAARRTTMALGFIAAIGLTAGTLWATNDRAWAWWTWPGAIGLAAGATIVVEMARRKRRRGRHRSGRRPTSERPGSADEQAAGSSPAS